MIGMDAEAKGQKRGGSGIRPAVARQIVSIARATVLEAVQQPIALLLLLSAVLMTLLVPVFQFHRFSEDGRLARDSGLSCMLVFGLALAAGTAGKSVADEIARGTAAAVIGKPVGRATFVIAKWLGVLGVTVIFWAGALAALLVAERSSAHFISADEFAGYASDPITLGLAFAGVASALAFAAARHGFWRRRFGVAAFTGVAASQVAVALLSGFYNRFGQLYALHGEAACRGCAAGAGHAHAGGQFFYNAELNLRVIPAALLLLFALALFAALATALATRFNGGAALAVCAAVLLLGLAGDTLLADAAFWSLRGLLSGVLPDLQNFWLCDAVAKGGRLPWGYVAAAGAYAATGCALFLSAGCRAFGERDLG
ncbi:MAG: hypothetical protein PHE10_07500 [Kiritimatiellae bacterium]|nr:hypothetical protein [Kiritimatiellia bacterium]